jgi:hypothetical protein
VWHALSQPISEVTIRSHPATQQDMPKVYLFVGMAQGFFHRVADASENPLGNGSCGYTGCDGPLRSAFRPGKTNMDTRYRRWYVEGFTLIGSGQLIQMLPAGKR